MRHFQQLSAGVNVLPLLHAVQRKPQLWDQNTLRTRHSGTVHSQVSDIWLRFNDTSQPEKVLDEHESMYYPAWYELPQARPLLFDLARLVEADRVGRVLITRLRPGGRIEPHVDGGSHAAYYDRYHLTLQATPGAIFRAEEEQVFMRPGDLWWFDNGVEHEVVNNGTDDRIVLIMDLHHG